MEKILNQTLEEDVSDRNVLTRKLYRYISEAAKRVDEGSHRSKSISDLFAPSLEVYRQKLRENCEKLIFADPLLYGRKAQELLWRKGYYEVVAMSKKLRQPCKDQEQLVIAHIDAGIGHYHSLISKVQHEIGIQIDIPLDYLHTEISSKKNTKKRELQKFKDFVESFVQNCLIYLGDLSRYKVDYDEPWAFKMSFRYYTQAITIDNNMGMPYNQLGTLHTGRNHHLDSVSYYIICLLCENPFDGAEGNLVRVFDKNSKLMDNTTINPDIIDQQEMIKIMICKFLSLVEHWFFDKPISNLNDLCTSTLYDIKECLRFQPLVTLEEVKDEEDYFKYIHQNELSPDHISANLINKMVIILLLLINKLHKEKSKLVMPLKTFTLTILSQLLHKLHNDFVTIGFDKDVLSKIVAGLKDKMKNQKNIQSPPVKLENGFLKQKDETSNVNGNSLEDLIAEPTVKCENYENRIVENDVDMKNDVKRENTLINGDDGDKTEKQPKTKSKKTSVLLKLRRRKRYVRSGSETSEEDDNDSVDDSNHSHSDNDDDSDQSSMEESDEDDDSYSTTSSENEHENQVSADKESDHDKSSEDYNKILKVETINHSSVDQNANDSVKDKDKTNDQEVNEQTVQFSETLFEDFLDYNNVLQSLHLMLTWLFGESELITSCGNNGRPLFVALVNVLNTIHGQLFPKLSWNHYCLVNQFHTSLKSFHELFFSLKYNGFRRVPIPEDFEIKNLEICGKGLKYIDWEKHVRTTLSRVEANTIRLMKIVDFGAFIVKLNVGVVFNKRLKLYLLKKASSKKPNYKKYGKNSRDIHNKSQRSYKQRNSDSDKNGIKQSSGSLMKNLGRLWLSEQVRALESEVGSKKQPNLPAYVILDADALCLHTNLVKQLVTSKRIIVLVPTIVLRTLDELKKDSGAARSAIRWLESQLANGSRFIRTQRPNENTPLPCVKYPKKIHRNIQNFIQIVEFCHFFLSNDTGESSLCKTNMNGSGDSNVSNNKYEDNKPGKNNHDNNNATNNNLVVLLVGSSNLYTEQKDFSYKGLANSAGITMETIQDFCFKWRHCFGKGSKKR